MSVDTLRWTVAVLISLAAHAALLIERGAPNPGTAPQATERVTRVQFRTALSMTPPREKSPVPPQVAVERGRKAVSKPVVEEKESVPTTQVEPTAPPSEVQDSVAVPAPSAETVEAAASEEGLIAARMRYARTLAAHIERFKFYPAVARRRGIVGGVRVGFIISPDGKAAALECDDGPEVLAAAACEAVRKAMPLPLPPPEFPLPMPVSFVMAFELK